ncbi:hypothetical protein [Streptomyces sp. TR06-5]|uniref:hypothetical protein n=1 Tax=unclassified Streptomyces TaxID=2593676 RepID=UPI00399EF05F
MAESVSVRCPDCRREHVYAPTTFPCACGEPVTLPLLASGVPVRVEHRTWADSWVTVRCRSCGRTDEWPQPEYGCPCGTTVRVPTAPPAPRPVPRRPDPLNGDRESARMCSASGQLGLHGPPDAPAAPGPPTRRPAFRPLTIRTAQDAKSAAAHYLRWLGFREVRVAGKRPASGVDLRGRAVVAHVDPTTAPTPLRAIETLWLNGLNESAATACFSLAGYAPEARARADDLLLPLFVLDLTGTPQPVNDAADTLIRTTT